MTPCFLLSLERAGTTICRTCELALPCRHDSAVLLSADDALLLLDALHAHRERVPSWQAERLAELAAELAAGFQRPDHHGTPWRPLHLLTEHHVGLTFADAAE